MKKIELHRWLGWAAAIALLAGCSSETPANKAVSPSKTGSSAAASAGSETNSPAVLLARSKFTVDPKLRDPFFPNSKRTSEPATGGPVNVAPMNVRALLQAGFIGTIGTGASRIGMINDVILEPGRTVVIPLRAPGGAAREVTARVRDVLPNAVILEIKGESQPVTIRLPQR